MGVYFATPFIPASCALSAERGLELDHLADWMDKIQVAPFAGAWIEIIRFVSLPASSTVAPFAGAWIEIFRTFFYI